MKTGGNREIFTASNRSIIFLVTTSFEGIENSKPDILYFRTDSKPKQNNLHDRHSQQDQHSTPVTENMIKFFLYESNKLFHNQSALRTAWRAKLLKHIIHCLHTKLFFQPGRRIQCLDLAVHHNRYPVAIFRFIHIMCVVTNTVIPRSAA